jgi:hypothetical protein
VCAGEMWVRGRLRAYVPSRRPIATVGGQRRQEHGARLGCYNVKLNAAKRRTEPHVGTYRAVKKGVLKAVGRVVHTARSGLAGADPPTAFGVPRSFFGRIEPGAGGPQCVFWNKRFQNVQKVTDAKNLAHSQPKARPEFVPRRGQPLAPKLPRSWPSICFIPDRPEGGAGISAVQTGAQRCCRSSLVIIDDLSALLECPDARMLVHAIYIVGLGQTVAMAASLEAAGGDPAKLLEKSLLRHRAINKSSKVTITCSETFRNRSPDIMKALSYCSNAPESQWTVAIHKSAPAAGNAATPHKPEHSRPSAPPRLLWQPLAPNNSSARGNQVKAVAAGSAATPPKPERRQPLASG